MAEDLRLTEDSFISSLASMKDIDKFVEEFAGALVKVREEFLLKIYLKITMIKKHR